ncbi:hypothetical protein CCH79_00017786, partial [Gambusia affinis]
LGVHDDIAYVSVKSVSSNYKVNINNVAVTHQVSGFNGIDLLKVWVFALIILFIAGLGIYAAIAENNIALKIFAGLTVFMMVIYLVMGVLFTIYREVITDYFNKSDKELMNLLINGTQSEGIQREGKCCGVLRAEDWGTKIPESCKCTATGPDLKSKCKPRPQSCKNLFLMAVRMVPTVAMALFYGFVCIEDAGQTWQPKRVVGVCWEGLEESPVRRSFNSHQNFGPVPGEVEDMESEWTGFRTSIVEAAHLSSRLCFCTLRGNEDLNSNGSRLFAVLAGESRPAHSLCSKRLTTEMKRRSIVRHPSSESCCSQAGWGNMELVLLVLIGTGQLWLFGPLGCGSEPAIKGRLSDEERRCGAKSCCVNQRFHLCPEFAGGSCRVLEVTGFRVKQLQQLLQQRVVMSCSAAAALYAVQLLSLSSHNVDDTELN